MTYIFTGSTYEDCLLFCPQEKRNDCIAYSILLDDEDLMEAMGYEKEYEYFCGDFTFIGWRKYGYETLYLE